MKFKLAIIGYGYWGPKLARNFLNSSKFDISFVVDNYKKNLIRAKNDFPLTKTLENYKDIDLRNIDLVVISSPTSTHFKLAKFI